ncbi:uncharacterized protein BDV17DRAFT_287160 [Aspergillus undulatus]|uniref:uncharacterized protein n=1 Tax=Aspergillus undulatus TaxID=1810928 RepID=UPI003CCD8CC0
MTEPTCSSTDTDKPATTYDGTTPTFIVKTDNIANLILGPQFYKCNITVQDPEMAEDDNREITLSSHDSIREIAEAGRLLQSVMQRLPADIFRAGAGSRVFIRAVQCIDLTGGENSDGDGKYETPKNKDHGEVELPNSPVTTTLPQAMREEDMASQPARARSTSDEPLLRKRKRNNTGPSSQVRKSARLMSA